jgi:nucleoside-diphosphate-sugar epimerase
VTTALLRGQATRLTPGEQVRDYLHAADVASALWAIAQGDLAGPVNVASGSPVTNRQVARLLGDLAGRPDLLRFGDLPYRPGDPMFVCADNRRLLEATGWRPNYDLESGLQDTLSWWRGRLDVH